MLTSLRPALLLIFTSCAVTATAADTYWSGLLGPDRTGWVSEFKTPAEWPAKLHAAWRVEVGEGYGTPLVEGDRVYQHGRVDNNEVLTCVNLATGEQIWRSSRAVPFRVRGGGEFHGAGPKSCPVMADGRVFTMSITGELTAWNAGSGDELWHSDYGKKYKQNHPHWGASTSPIVDGDRVILHFGNDDAGELVALDVADGTEIWSLSGEGASYSSPLIAEFHGVRQVVEWNHKSLCGVDIENGTKLWSTPFAHDRQAHDQNMPTPTIHNGTVLLGAENRGLHCYRPQLKDGKWSVDTVWDQKKIALNMSTAVINDGMFYGMSHYGKGRMFCVDPASGDIFWQTEGRFGQNAAFLAIPGHIVALNDRGGLQIVAASSDGFRSVASWKVSDNSTWAPPVLLDGGFLIKDRSHLTYLNFSGE